MATIKLDSLDTTQAFGRQFATRLQGGDVVFLQGDLGAGKTTLVRAILQGLGYTGHVKSPTFTLVEPYHLHYDVYHFDLYRIKAPAELEDIGWRDYFHGNSICLIEWPEKAGNLLPKPTWSIRLEMQGEYERTAILS